MQEEWITTSEVKELTGASGGSIHWAIRSGYIRGKRSGKMWLVDKQSALKYFQGGNKSVFQERA